MKKCKKIAGMDEAGRGCVIGPMVVGCVAISESREAELCQLGVGDSKKFSPKKREELYQKILQLPGVEVGSKAVLPAEIDRANLTTLTKQATVELARQLGPELVYLDVPAPPSGVARYLASIQKELGDMEVLGDNRGEDKFILVATASIVAKVRRDQFIEELRQKHGDFGSGYPSDPKTRAFLQKLIDEKQPLPDFIRKKWKTLDKLRQSRFSW